MHYYPHHIGDFIRDTARLSDSQCMAYLRLIWIYYQQESPLPDEPEKLAFQIGSDAGTVRLILEHFFHIDADGMHSHSRCNAVIEEYRAKEENARKAANARWNNANAKRKQCERNADASKNDANQEPITNNQINKEISLDISSSKPLAVEPADNCPHSEIIDLYRQKLPELTQPLKARWIGSKGSQALRIRWREDQRHQSLEFWGWFFDTVRTNPFWLGQNDRGWKADLPWLVKRENFDKVLAKGVERERI